MPTDGKLPYRVRDTLMRLWDERCSYCGAVLLDSKSPHIEHITPSVRGGCDMLHNLTMACKKCNGTKGIRTAEEFGRSDVAERALVIEQTFISALGGDIGAKDILITRGIVWREVERGEYYEYLRVFVTLCSLHLGGKSARTTGSISRDRDFYKPSEVAAMIGVGRSRVYELIANGTIGSVKLGERKVLIPRSAIDALISAKGSV